MTLSSAVNSVPALTVLSSGKSSPFALMVMLTFPANVSLTTLMLTLVSSPS
jgi:hypothetical protein